MLLRDRESLQGCKAIAGMQGNDEDPATALLKKRYSPLVVVDCLGSLEAQRAKVVGELNSVRFVPTGIAWPVYLVDFGLGAGYGHHFCIRFVGKEEYGQRLDDGGDQADALLYRSMVKCIQRSGFASDRLVEGCLREAVGNEANAANAGACFDFFDESVSFLFIKLASESCRPADGYTVSVESAEGCDWKGPVGEFVLKQIFAVVHAKIRALGSPADSLVYSLGKRLALRCSHYLPVVGRQHALAADPKPSIKDLKAVADLLFTMHDYFTAKHFYEVCFGHRSGKVSDEESKLIAAAGVMIVLCDLVLAEASQLLLDADSLGLLVSHGYKRVLELVLFVAVLSLQRQPVSKRLLTVERILSCLPEERNGCRCWRLLGAILACRMHVLFRSLSLLKKASFFAYQSCSYLDGLVELGEQAKECLGNAAGVFDPGRSFLLTKQKVRFELARAGNATVPFVLGSLSKGYSLDGCVEKVLPESVHETRLVFAKVQSICLESVFPDGSFAVGQPMVVSFVVLLDSADAAPLIESFSLPSGFFVQKCDIRLASRKIEARIECRPLSVGRHSIDRLNAVMLHGLVIGTIDLTLPVSLSVQASQL